MDRYTKDTSQDANWVVQRKWEIKERTKAHSVYLTLLYLTIIICCLVMLIIMVMSGIRFIHVMIVLPVYMLNNHWTYQTYV